MLQDSKMGRIKRDLKKVEMPGNGPNGESITYADFRRNQAVYAVDMTAMDGPIADFCLKRQLWSNKRMGPKSRREESQVQFSNRP